MLTTTGRSNLLTMGAAAKRDPRQRVPAQPTTPLSPLALLRARLILEEAIETVHALGFALTIDNENIKHPAESGKSAIIKCVDDMTLVVEREADLLEVIDGCCDTIYVCTGTLLMCGVPDAPHLNEVNRANNDKFPNGEAIVNAHGKFLKPAGWLGPNHTQILRDQKVDLQEMTQKLLEGHEVEVEGWENMPAHKLPETGDAAE